MADRPNGVSESFGTIRYGRLAEVLLYDIRRTATLAGPSAVYIDSEAERWLAARMADPDVSHVVHAPSNPPGWTAGKWGEWYPDVLGPDKKLTLKTAKPYWQPGWLKQHDRILTAMSAMKGAIYLFARAVVLLGAARAAVFPSLVPGFTLLIGYLALGIVPSLLQLLGFAIVLAGFRLTQKG